MSRLLEVADLCSRTLSDPANRLRKTRKKKSSAVPLFRSGHISAICARLSTGKVGVQRGRKTAGCPSFLPTAVGTASPPRRVPRRSRRPQTANPHAEVQRKTFPPGKGEPACGSSRTPAGSGAEKEPPRQERTRLRSSYAPLTRCRKALPTLRAPAYKSKTEVSLGFLLSSARREPFLRSVAWRTSA